MDKSLEDQIVWGGLYKHVGSTRFQHDQAYNQAVPVRDKDGKLWMQDTYQLNIPSCKKGQTKFEASIDRFMSYQDGSIGQYVLNKSKWDYYHPGNQMINSLENYELICDLREYRNFEVAEDYRHYDNDDIVYGIHLYREHGYSWDYGDIGVKLIKRDAVPKIKKMFISELEDVRSKIKQPQPAWGNLDSLKKLFEQYAESEEVDPKLKVDYENVLWLQDKVSEMRNEIASYMLEHRYIYHFDFENEDITLGSIHPDIERYLKEDCYCPGEIYDTSGIHYEIFRSSDKCKVIKGNKDRTAVVSRAVTFSEVCDPQIVLFWHDDTAQPGKIIAAQRVDVTQENIGIVKTIVDGGSPDGRKITYYKDESEDDINALINSL